MHPTTPTNLDVVLSDSITPVSISAFNVGQDRLRWLHVFSDNVVCDAIRFSHPGSFDAGTVFTAARLIDNERRIDLNSIDCAKLILDNEKMKTDYTALLSKVT